MPEVVLTDEMTAWWDDLDEDGQERLGTVIDLLERLGVSLGMPYSSQIKGSKIAMRELRAQSNGRPLRVLYAFDPSRNAVLLIGGDKTGDSRFYERMIPHAEKIWDVYIKETEQ